jgi:hypothetical protein
MQVIRLLVTGQMDRKTAGLLLYALQIASSNLPNTTFEPYLHDVVLDPRKVDETPLGKARLWAFEDFAEDDAEDEEEDEAAEESPAAASPKKAAAFAPGPDPVTGENPSWAKDMPPLALKVRTVTRPGEATLARMLPKGMTMEDVREELSKEMKKVFSPPKG